jgi:hypothetical protein
MISLNKNNKIQGKQHFSLFMVKKAINKQRKKDSSILTIINIHDSAKLEIPKFLDPIKFFRLYGDTLITLTSSKVISLYSEYKEIQRIDFNIQNQTLRISLQNSTFQHDSWEVLVDRLISLNNIDAYNLANEIKITFAPFISENKGILLKEREFIPKNLPFYQNYQNEISRKVQELEENNKIYIIFRFQVFDILIGPELIDITYSKNCMEFFAGSIEDFINLIVENKLVDIYSFHKTEYFQDKAKIIMAFRKMTDHAPIKLLFKTKEGLEFASEFKQFPFFYGDEDRQEISCIVTTIIPRNTFDFLEKYRSDEILKYKKNKLNLVKDLREKRLEKILRLYYKSEKDEKCIENFDETIPFSQGNLLLKEKICGFRNLT